MRVKRASFSLEEDYQELFRTISEITRRSMTDELRIMLDARATTLGLEPVKSFDQWIFSVGEKEKQRE